MYVKNRMTKNPICIDVNSKISDVVDIMSERELHRIPAVSYTHLDVYKRQLQNLFQMTYAKGNMFFYLILSFLIFLAVYLCYYAMAYIGCKRNIDEVQ